MTETSVQLNQEATVREIATVTVLRPVDGTPRKKPRKKGKAKPKAAVDTHAITVRPDVWAAAKAARREGERIVIVSETEVWLR